MRGLSPVAASGGHSSSRCAGLSLSRPLLLWSTGSRCAGSVIVAHGPSCSAACGIFPDQGLNPCPLHWQADSQPLCHQGSPQSSSFKHSSSFLCHLCLFNSYLAGFHCQVIFFQEGLMGIVSLEYFHGWKHLACCLLLEWHLGWYNIQEKRTHFLYFKQKDYKIIGRNTGQTRREYFTWDQEQWEIHHHWMNLGCWAATTISRAGREKQQLLLFFYLLTSHKCFSSAKPNPDLSQQGSLRNVLGWPKDAFSFFHKMALVALSCL